LLASFWDCPHAADHTQQDGEFAPTVATLQGGRYRASAVIDDDDDDVLYEVNEEVYDGNVYCDGRRTEKKGRTLTAPKDGAGCDI
jgi:hypothetical protein